ncbi:MAG: hypothetical protein WBC60_05415 [Cognaticolwellia sp.]|jgi:hypothetical protein
MYTWNEIKEDSNLVIYGYVQAAKLIKYDSIEASIMQPNIQLEVSTEEIYYDKGARVTSNETFSVYLESANNPVAVGSYGFFFLTCDVRCKGVDAHFSAWPITQVWVQKEVDSRNNIEVIDFENLLVGYIPRVLWTEHVEETFDGVKPVLSPKNFIKVKTLKAKLAELFNET